MTSKTEGDWKIRKANMSRKISWRPMKKGHSVEYPFGEPAGIQTLDLQNRNLTLYSAKLRGLKLQRLTAYTIALDGAKVSIFLEFMLAESYFSVIKGIFWGEVL